ncbi:Protein F59B2.13 [Aphelenchoides avenae]|nr:Protein F59B2.13 [Aphelenchus avenae]
MAVNATYHCLKRDELRLTTSVVEQSIIGYIVPVLIVFGVTGNLVNLTVLVAPGMKTRSNTLLAALALADVFFLLTFIPHALATYPVQFDYAFRVFYYATKMHWIAFANWFSAVAIWMVLAICLERLVGIINPLSVRKRRACRTHILIWSIITATFILTFFHHYTYDCITKVFCHGSQYYGICLPIIQERWLPNRSNPHSLLLRNYVRWSLHLNAWGIVLLPTLVVVVSNVLLIYTLRKRKQFIEGNSDRSTEPLNSRSSSGAMQLRTEHRVTLTVCAIATCFTITHTPSAVVHLANEIMQADTSEWVVITNLLVVLGKSLNFVLFCLSSSTFRQRLIQLTMSRIHKRSSTRYASSQGYVRHVSNVRRLYKTTGKWRSQKEFAPACGC